MPNQHIRMVTEGSYDTGVMMLKIQLFHHKNKLNLKNIFQQKMVKIVIIFHNITVFLIK